MSGYDVAQDGQSPNSFATGQGIKELGSAADYNIREYQTALKHSAELRDRKRLEWEEKMHPKAKKRVFWYEGGTNFEETYIPEKDIAKDYRTSRVYGAMASFDENSKIIAGLQLLQARIIDRRTLQENLDNFGNISLVNERIDQDMAKEQMLQGLGQRFAEQDPAAAMALVEILSKPADTTETLKKLFTPQEPQMSPEEMAMAGQGMPGEAEMGPPPAVQTILAQMESPGGGVQSCGADAMSAHFVLDGVSSYLECDNANLLDADTAHVEQSPGLWLANSAAVEISDDVALFGENSLKHVPVSSIGLFKNNYPNTIQCEANTRYTLRRWILGKNIKAGRQITPTFSMLDAAGASVGAATVHELWAIDTDMEDDVWYEMGADLTTPANCASIRFNDTTSSGGNYDGSETFYLGQAMMHAGERSLYPTFVPSLNMVRTIDMACTFVPRALGVKDEFIFGVYPAADGGYGLRPFTNGTMYAYVYDTATAGIANWGAPFTTLGLVDDTKASVRSTADSSARIMYVNGEAKFTGCWCRRADKRLATRSELHGWGRSASVGHRQLLHRRRFRLHPQGRYRRPRRGLAEP